MPALTSQQLRDMFRDNFPHTRPGEPDFDTDLDITAHNLHRLGHSPSYQVAWRYFLLANDFGYENWQVCEECARPFHRNNPRGLDAQSGDCAECREAQTTRGVIDDDEDADELIPPSEPRRSDNLPRTRDRDDDVPAIMPYSTNPLSYTQMTTFKAAPKLFKLAQNKKFYGQSVQGATMTLDQTLYMGAELEVECDDNSQHVSARIIQRAAFGSENKRLFIIKTDGSLDDGLEIVTAPCSLEMFMSDQFKPLFDKFEEAGVLADRTDTCGMHVHVSRAALTPLVLGRLLVFINKRANAHFIGKMANRPVIDNRWASINSCYDAPNAVKLIESTGNRYSAINLGRSDTIEFRIFKGTCKRQTFLENVQFVDAAVNFARDTSTRALADTDFIKWVDQPAKAKRYRYLHNKLVRLGLVRPHRNNSLERRAAA